MKLFCAVCEKEVTDNIAVFENIDGVIVHCGDCNYPLLFVPYDEPGWFGNPVSREDKNTIESKFEELDEQANSQLPLFSEDECICTDPFLDTIVFTPGDIDYLGALLSKKIERLGNLYCKTEEDLCSPALRVYNDEGDALKKKLERVKSSYQKAALLYNKIQTIQELRGC